MVAVTLFCMTIPGIGQVSRPSDAEPAQELGQFAVSGVSRLNALAKLGAATRSTLLVVCGDMRFLSEPVTLFQSHKSLDDLVMAVLRGRERYFPVHRGRLIVISATRPRARRNRILNLPLGAVSFNGKAISSLSPLLDLYIRKFTGCNPTGYGYAGPAMEAGIPPFALETATFEKVVEQVAMAPVPSMWILSPDTGKNGCIPNPGSMWQVGLYAGVGSEHPFRESTGPQFVH